MRVTNSCYSVVHWRSGRSGCVVVGRRSWVGRVVVSVCFLFLVCLCRLFSRNFFLIYDGTFSGKFYSVISIQRYFCHYFIETFAQAAQCMAVDCGLWTHSSVLSF